MFRRIPPIHRIYLQPVRVQHKRDKPGIRGERREIIVQDCFRLRRCGRGGFLPGDGNGIPEHAHQIVEHVMRKRAAGGHERKEQRRCRDNPGGGAHRPPTPRPGTPTLPRGGNHGPPALRRAFHNSGAFRNICRCPIVSMRGGNHGPPAFRRAFHNGGGFRNASRRLPVLPRGGVCNGDALGRFRRGRLPRQNAVVCRPPFRRAFRVLLFCARDHLRKRRGRIGLQQPFRFRERHHERVVQQFRVLAQKCYRSPVPHIFIPPSLHMTYRQAKM